MSDADADGEEVSGDSLCDGLPDMCLRGLLLLPFFFNIPVIAADDDDDDGE